MTDVRKRRAERARRQHVKAMIPRVGKTALIAVVVIAAVAAAATLYKAPPGKRFVHDHAAWALFTDGQLVSFEDRAYDMSQNKDKYHMHPSGGGGGSVWHIEASFPNGVPDVSLTEAFRQYGVAFSPGYLKVDTRAGHNGSEWRDQGNQTLQVFLSKGGADGRKPFQPVENYTSYTPQNLDKILVTYGNITAEQLAQQEGAVPAPPGEPGAPPSSTMPGA